MKKVILSILVISLLLLILTACGVEAKQSEPEPAPKIEEPKPEPLAAPEKVEISQEELEPIFKQVYTEASGNHPEDWSIDFQITDEIGKITKAIPEDKKAPANLREIYIEWRAAKTDPEPTAEPEPENILTFTDCNETVYATSQVNIRTGPGTNYNKLGSLGAGNQVRRIGIGTGTADGWSQIQLNDGSLAYVSSKYLSYTKPTVQQPQTSQGTRESSTGTSTGESTAQPGDPNGFGPKWDPTQGKTQEELEAEWAEIDEANKDVHFQ